MAKNLLLVNAEWEDLSAGESVSYNGNSYEIGVDAFSSLASAKAAAGAETELIQIVGGSYNEDQVFDGYAGVIGSEDVGVSIPGYVFAGGINAKNGDVSLSLVNGSVGYVYGAGTDKEGSYSVGDILLEIGENMTLTGRIAAAKVDKGKLVTGNVEIDFAAENSPDDVALFGGAQVWYEGSSVTHESVTVNVSGELTDVVYAAGQAMHGGWITIKNGVTTNVSGGSIGADGLLGGGFARSDEGSTDTAGGIHIDGGTWINISGGSIADVYGGSHTYSLNGRLTSVSTITGGTHITMTGGEVGNVQGGGYTAWGSEATIDSTEISIFGGTVYGDVQGGSYVVGGGKDKDSGNSSTIGTTSVEISGDADILGSVYGGSWVNWATGTAASYITGLSTVIVKGGNYCRECRRRQCHLCEQR